MGFHILFLLVIYTTCLFFLLCSLHSEYILMICKKLPIIKHLINLYLHYFEKATQPMTYMTLDNAGQPKRLCTLYPKKNETVRSLKIRGIKMVIEIFERQEQERDKQGA